MIKQSMAKDFPSIEAADAFLKTIPPIECVGITKNKDATFTVVFWETVKEDAHE